MGMGGPSLPPPIATLPAGIVSGLLAANRALAVLALADASGYNWEPETSPSRRMEQGRAEIRALGWEFPAGLRAESDLHKATSMPRYVVAPWPPNTGSR